MGIIVLHHRLFCGLNDLLFAKDLETAPGTYINNKKLNNRHLETLSLACMWMDGWMGDGGTGGQSGSKLWTIFPYVSSVTGIPLCHATRYQIPLMFC